MLKSTVQATTFSKLKKETGIDKLIFNPLPKSDDSSPDSKDFL